MLFGGEPGDGVCCANVGCPKFGSSADNVEEGVVGSVEDLQLGTRNCGEEDGDEYCTRDMLMH